MKYPSTPILVLLLVLVISIGYTGYQKYQSTFQTSVVSSPTPFPASSPPPTELIPTITQGELKKGWYWGSADQKKPGTPADWIFKEAGRSSCWHKPGNSCQTIRDN